MRDERDIRNLPTRYLGLYPIRHCTLVSTKTYSEFPDERLKRTRREREREREREDINNETSRLEKKEKRQPHLNHHEKFLFSTVLLLFAQYNTHDWRLVT
jgi:hypothetical protein